MQYGSGAAAIQARSGEDDSKIPRKRLERHAIRGSFSCGRRKYDYQWEERWVRDEGYLKIVPEAVGRLFKDKRHSGGSHRLFVHAGYDFGSRGRGGKRLKIKLESIVDNLAAKCGDTGAAHPLHHAGGGP